MVEILMSLVIHNQAGFYWLQSLTPPIDKNKLKGVFRIKCGDM